MIDLMIWAPDRSSFVSGMIAYGFAEYTKEDGLSFAPGVLVDEIGEIVVTPPTYDEAGNTLTPSVVVPGHHANVRLIGNIAEQLTRGRTARGTIFDKTSLLSVVPILKWQPGRPDKVPPGYVGAYGLRIYDPQSVYSPARVWA